MFGGKRIAELEAQLAALQRSFSTAWATKLAVESS